MKYDKELLKEKAVQLYIEGKNYIEIANIIGCSRNYVSELIRNDTKVVDVKNKRVLKLCKRLNKSRINVTIPLSFWEKIGVSKNEDIMEEVEITVNELEQIIVIRKH